MKRTIEITFEWWNLETPQAEIPKEHVEYLEEHATQRVAEMWQDGFTFGKMEETTPDGTEYGGWFNIKTLTEEDSLLLIRKLSDLEDETREAIKKIANELNDNEIVEFNNHFVADKSGEQESIVGIQKISHNEIKVLTWNDDEGGDQTEEIYNGDYDIDSEVLTAHDLVRIYSELR